MPLKPQRPLFGGLDGTRLIGITSYGRATVETLQMNNEYAVEARRFWVFVGSHPPPD